MFTVMDKRKKLGKWLLAEFVRYQNDLGYPIHQADFARKLGIIPSVFSQYVNGHRMPSMETIEAISKVLGAEIYDVLAIPRPDPALEYIIARWGLLKPEEQQELQEHVDRMLQGDNPGTDPAPDPVGT